jgi:hypothetical protein
MEFNQNNYKKYKKINSWDYDNSSQILNLRSLDNLSIRIEFNQNNYKKYKKINSW